MARTTLGVGLGLMMGLVVACGIVGERYVELEPDPETALTETIPAAQADQAGGPPDDAMTVVQQVTTTATAAFGATTPSTSTTTSEAALDEPVSSTVEVAEVEEELNEIDDLLAELDQVLSELATALAQDEGDVSP